MKTMCKIEAEAMADKDYTAKWKEVIKCKWLGPIIKISMFLFAGWCRTRKSSEFLQNAFGGLTTPKFSCLPWERFWVLCVCVKAALVDAARVLCCPWYCLWNVGDCVVVWVQWCVGLKCWCVEEGYFVDVVLMRWALTCSDCWLLMCWGADVLWDGDAYWCVDVFLVRW